MTPYEMEEQLKNLDARTMAIAQILPTLATREDLRNEVAKLATKDELRKGTEVLRDELRKSTEVLRDDLRLTVEALQHEIETGFEAAKAHADRLNEVTREQSRIVADQVALVARQMATKRELQQLQQTLSAQIAALGASRRNKKR
jgi:hypothetical protein